MLSVFDLKGVTITIQLDPRVKGSLVYISFHRKWKQQTLADKQASPHNAHQALLAMVVRRKPVMDSPSCCHSHTQKCDKGVDK